MKFTNLTCVTEPESTLFPEEINAILAVIQALLRETVPGATKGTFILDGQKFGEDADCILRFNLPDGVYAQHFFGVNEPTSDESAERAIDEILAMPGCSRYTDNNDLMRTQIRSAHDVKSGIWRDHELRALVLNTTCGRFIMSCYIEYYDEVAETILYTVARTIAEMGKEDLDLQTSVKRIASDCNTMYARYRRAEMLVERLFSAHQSDPTNELPEIAAWRAWHESANQNGELTLFFQ